MEFCGVDFCLGEFFSWKNDNQNSQVGTIDNVNDFIQVWLASI